MIKITNHCNQRLSERYLLDMSFEELEIIRKLIKTGYYVKIQEEDKKVKILTRYKGRYLPLVMTKNLYTFITALPYTSDLLPFIEQFVKEFD